jgi:hypothetical protein
VCCGCVQRTPASVIDDEGAEELVGSPTADSTVKYFDEQTQVDEVSRQVGPWA